jgi:uncharacterized protein (TIGR03435 family)
VRVWQIEGGPGWFSSLLWDVEGKSEQKSLNASSKPLDQSTQHARLMLMLQSLLEDRFKLRIERPTRQSAVYNLVVSKDGPKIKLDDDQSPPGRANLGSPQASASSWELQRGAISIRSGPNETTIEGRAVTMPTFITILLSYSDRPIIDCTNLKGLYNFKVSWPKEETGLGGSTASSSPLATTKVHSVPAIFTALQEQLGLRLESANGPVEFLVITSVQKPSGN